MTDIELDQTHSIPWLRAQALSLSRIECREQPPSEGESRDLAKSLDPCASRKDKLKALTSEKYIQILEQSDSCYYRFDFVCAQCGFHSLKMTRSEAEEMARDHVFTHWYDVSQYL
jgi:hypothetical protein